MWVNRIKEHKNHHLQPIRTLPKSHGFFERKKKQKLYTNYYYFIYKTESYYDYCRAKQKHKCFKSIEKASFNDILTG